MSKTIVLDKSDLEKNINYARDLSSRRRYSYIKTLCGTNGENAYAIFSGKTVNRVIYEDKKGDGGIDFEDGTQVKTSSWNGIGVELKINKDDLERAIESKSVKKYVLVHVDESRTETVNLIGEISFESFLIKKKEKWYNGRYIWIVDESELDIHY